MEHLVFTVQNLKCGGCANTITQKLSALGGLKDISVEVDQSTVGFTYNHPDDLQQAQKVLAEIGYPIVGQANPLRAKAMSMVSCALGKIAKN